ncbi:MAG: S-layer homology domain-containing protein, partial [Acidobacteria bacterium]|nr:S-layer homology domain-containing protein [Acidobacteriota bacterium]
QTRDGSFFPTRPLTRAELASLFVRAFVLPPAAPAGFGDTAGNEHAANIDALAAAGITKGCNPPANSLFCPDRITTRGEIASFLVRALALPAAPSQPFIDVSGSVHRNDAAALALAGITKGCNPPTNNRFCPNDPVTRGQMAAFLHRAFG